MFPCLCPVSLAPTRLQHVLCFVVSEENPNFVTLDEVWEEEEEKITPRTRGRPRKRAKQTPGNSSRTIV